MNNKKLYLGIDVGSTTVKINITNEQAQTINIWYERHSSKIKETILKQLTCVYELYGKDYEYSAFFTGSASKDLAESLGFGYIQEVNSLKNAISVDYKEIDHIFELGGEDAKYVNRKTNQQDMNSDCAAGTGAFIDRMSVLLGNLSPIELNDIAKDYEKIYPIAARCGVFAQTDLQPLINSGVPAKDLAKSIFDAVALQYKSGLIKGRELEGKVAFLGGPLTYLSELRESFIRILEIKQEDIIDIINSKVNEKNIEEQQKFKAGYVARGAALTALASTNKITPLSFDVFKAKMDEMKNLDIGDMTRHEPLFSSIQEYRNFKERHALAKVLRKELNNYTGEAFLGIDGGSTTTKIVLIDPDGYILYEDYGNNEGNPLETTKNMLIKMYQNLPSNVEIKNTGVTGYAEAMLQKILNVDIGIVETEAHLTAAEYFLGKSGEKLIIDIGGQDIKVIWIDKNGFIKDIKLNEICSAGCGSFISTQAERLGISIDEFIKMAIEATSPVDLKDRCTVFMQSSIVTAQKMGISPDNITAGLCYSVISNFVNKVFGYENLSILPDKIIVQGGTFKNDGVLRALEKMFQREVVRPDASGVMGAYGMAILSHKQYNKAKTKSKFLTLEQLKDLHIIGDPKTVQCQKCTNKCQLIITSYSNNQKFITGNKCDNGILTSNKELNDITNLVPYIKKLTFERDNNKENPRNKIGIPRALLNYDLYPFWHTFYTNLGFEVVLSDESTHKQYEKGSKNIPSESACYPAKLLHGHIQDLIDKGVKHIFMPCISKYFDQKMETCDRNDCKNCPMVTSYSNTIKNNTPELKKNDIIFSSPDLSLYSESFIYAFLNDPSFKNFNFNKHELYNAYSKALKEQKNYRDSIKYKAKKIWDSNEKIVVLLIRPYQLDNEVLKKIDEMYRLQGYHVITSDSIGELGEYKKLRVSDRHAIPRGHYKAIIAASKRPNTIVACVNSFNCGMNAALKSQIEELGDDLSVHINHLYTDENVTNGSLKIRIRSHIAAISRNNKKVTKKTNEQLNELYNYRAHIFTKKMKKTHTILIPGASDHFRLLGNVFSACGYKIEYLDNKYMDIAIKTGLKYMDNNICYPCIQVAGQLMAALQSGDYDLNKTAVTMSQTGGGCRATEYLPNIRYGLKKAGLTNIPAISLSIGQNIDPSKFPIFQMLNFPINAINALYYADILEKLVNKNKSHEINNGESEELYEKWLEIGQQYFSQHFIKRTKNNISSKARILIKTIFSKGNSFGMSSIDYNTQIKSLSFKQLIYKMIDEFEEIKVKDIDKKPKIGVLGEIYLEINPLANHDIINKGIKNGCEVVSTGVMDFAKYCLANAYINKNLYRRKATVHNLKGYLSYLGLIILNQYEKSFNKRLINSSKKYIPMMNVLDLLDDVQKVISLGSQTGEGWMIAAKAIHYINNNITNIISVQPWGCLPNHMVAKGIQNKLYELYKNVTFLAQDFDASNGQANIDNRLIGFIESIKNDMKSVINNLHKLLEETEQEKTFDDNDPSKCLNCSSDCSVCKLNPTNSNSSLKLNITSN